MFIFAKLVNLFLNPALWVWVILIRAALTRNPYTRKRWLLFGFLFFLFFSSPLIIQRVISVHQWQPRPMQRGETYAAGILLGGVMSYDEHYDEAFFMGAQDRFIQTLKLYQTGHIQKIIVSGGNAVFAKGNFREGYWLAKNLEAMGVPAEDIINERRAKNTVENARYAHLLMDSLGIKGPIVLITSAWHMTRSMKIFEQEGIESRPFPCDFLMLPSHRSIRWVHLLPSGAVMEQWNLLLKEWIGIAAISLQRRFTH